MYIVYHEYYYIFGTFLVYFTLIIRIAVSRRTKNCHRLDFACWRRCWSWIPGSRAGRLRSRQGKPGWIRAGRRACPCRYYFTIVVIHQWAKRCLTSWSLHWCFGPALCCQPWLRNPSVTWSPLVHSYLTMVSCSPHSQAAQWCSGACLACIVHLILYQSKASKYISEFFYCSFFMNYIHRFSTRQGSHRLILHRSCTWFRRGIPWA